MADPNQLQNGQTDHPLQKSAVEAIKREAVRLMSFCRLTLLRFFFLGYKEKEIEGYDVLDVMLTARLTH